MKILLVEAHLKSFSRVKDGSVKLSFTTAREIDKEEFSLMDGYYQQKGWLAFKIDEFVGDEIPDGNTNVPGGKSPSQILRNSLFARHMNNGGTKEDFPAYYNKMMAQFDAAANDYERQ